MNSFQDLNLNKKYTYADYLTWKFEERVELLKGWVVKMSPAPNMRHQEIATTITGEIYKFLENRPCKVFAAPFDVRLPLPLNNQVDNSINTVVQPDVTVVCDLAKLDKQGCIGAPGIVVEVLSPGNTKKEMRDKLEIYQNAGIPEYWLVDPEHEFVLMYVLNELGIYTTTRPLTIGDQITSYTLKGFTLDADKIFKE